ncbi:glycosyltransferase family 4 protein [Flavobacterium ammonificans]|uniref:Glycosyltransferase WbuB n=1 Tax=Flavobacterium ammonificans TaxID=1751056 RepID=A0ABN6KUC8_9FLAO|nr:glycosyltransferase family 4 protein [Flavobacterium ammonificans]BDB52707.1 glycosyltransferase WbuB [Flavobacterium ammonificans]
MINRKILIHSIVFSPDGVSTAYLYNDIALGFKKNGYEVVVLTTTPHYNIVIEDSAKQPLRPKLMGLFYESSFNEIRVIHVPLKKYKSTTLRILSFIYWHLFSFFIGLSINKIDFILSPSPPLSIGFVSILIAKIKKAKIVYNVQEIYPDLLINQGGLKSKLIINILKWLEKFVYNNSNAVITIDQLFYNQIKNRFKNIQKLNIIPNFVDTELYKPETKETLPLVFTNDLSKLKLLYAGNIGFFQDWEPIFYAAKKLLNANIEFWIIGEGVRKEYLMNRVKEEKLSNIKILPYQNRNLMPAINSFADIHFISISKEMEQEGFPSKVYTIMACAKPMIILTGENTPLFNFLSGKNCSVLISDNSNDSFVESIISLASDKNKQFELGQNGYNEIQNFYTKEKVIEKYVDLFEKI